MAKIEASQTIKDPTPARRNLFQIAQIGHGLAKIPRHPVDSRRHKSILVISRREGLRFRPVNAAEFTCLGPLANSSNSSEGLLAAMHGSDRCQACDRLTVAGDRHFLASLHQSSNWPSLFFTSKAPISMGGVVRLLARPSVISTGLIVATPTPE